MIKIRRNTFETNSSSTHSICISKKPVITGSNICFNIGEFGWGNESVNPANYLYTAILELDDDEHTMLNKLKSILKKNGIGYRFEAPKYGKWGEHSYLEYGYIDHVYEAREFVTAVLNDEDLLMRYLFGDSAVYTGNDNSSDMLDKCFSAYETIEICDNEDVPWPERNWVEISNPNHDSDNYDYFYKGN